MKQIFTIGARRLSFSLDLRGGGRSTSRQRVRSQISCNRGGRGQIAARSWWSKGCVAVEKRLRCADLASR
ncbi:hypothetical protein WN944_016827 [Citrus x changshan-huyou]|uniref:Uncharacterized protein n=1 Tax=Citrus x changshan-huyou TaxID=2935761 RepID=A0AAP0QN73_9ROSI